MRGADGGGEVGTKGRRRAACLGLTGACCRPGAGRRPGSPPPKSSPSRDAPWPPGSRLWSRMPRRVSEGCGSAQPPIGRLANRRPRGQRAGQPPTPPPPPGQWRGCGLRRSPSRTLVPGPPAPRAAPAQPEGLRAEEAGRRVGAPLLFAGVGLSPPSRAGAPRERARSPVPRLCAWTRGGPRRQTAMGGRRVWKSEHVSTEVPALDGSLGFLLRKMGMSDEAGGQAGVPRFSECRSPGLASGWVRAASRGGGGGNGARHGDPWPSPAFAGVRQHRRGVRHCLSS